MQFTEILDDGDDDIVSAVIPFIVSGSILLFSFTTHFRANFIRYALLINIITFSIRSFILPLIYEKVELISQFVWSLFLVVTLNIMPLYSGILLIIDCIMSFIMITIYYNDDD